MKASSVLLIEVLVWDEMNGIEAGCNGPSYREILFQSGGVPTSSTTSRKKFHMDFRALPEEVGTFGGTLDEYALEFQSGT